MLHLYDHTTATMRGKLLSVATVVDAAGPEMDRSETVTVFNDLVVLSAEGATRPIDPNSACGGTRLFDLVGLMALVQKEVVQSARAAHLTYAVVGTRRPRGPARV